MMIEELRQTTERNSAGYLRVGKSYHTFRFVLPSGAYDEKT